MCWRRGQHRCRLCASMHRTRPPLPPRAVGALEPIPVRRGHDHVCGACWLAHGVRASAQWRTCNSTSRCRMLGQAFDADQEPALDTIRAAAQARGLRLGPQTEGVYTVLHIAWSCIRDRAHRSCSAHMPRANQEGWSEPVYGRGRDIMCARCATKALLQHARMPGNTRLSRWPVR